MMIPHFDLNTIIRVLSEASEMNFDDIRPSLLNIWNFWKVAKPMQLRLYGEHHECGSRTYPMTFDTVLNTTNRHNYKIYLSIIDSG
jgi:hypothetical protein